MKFPYVEFEARLSRKTSKKRLICRPIVPIILFYQKRVIVHDCLVDSGADQSVFNSDVAKDLGLNLRSGKRMPLRGVGGGIVNGYEHRLKLRVVGKDYYTKIIFSEDVLALYGVLGTRGFFDNFDVNFRYRKKYFEVY